jgi:hypothetical protein
VERSRPRLEAAPEQLPRSGDSSSVDIAEPQAQVITSAACWLTTGATINLNLVLGGQPRRRRPSAPAQRQRAGASHALHARRQRRSGDHPAHVTGHSSQLTPRRCPADSTTGPGCQPAHNDPFGCNQNRPPVHRTTAHSGGSVRPAQAKCGHTRSGEACHPRDGGQWLVMGSAGIAGHYYGGGHDRCMDRSAGGAHRPGTRPG